jgi:enoyl-CoA hydratase/carnithine racemase
MTLGLVTRIVPRAAFDTEATEALAFFAERAVALKIGKQAWRQGNAGATLGARVRALAPLMLENFAHPDVQARIATALGPVRG